MLGVALIEPSHPGNIGAIARIMANFGFFKLILIDPQCSLKAEAEWRSKHGIDVLHKAKICGIEELDKWDYVIGTSAKLGSDTNIRRSPKTPRQAAEFIAGRHKRKKVLLVFGRESEGLLNTELEKCDLLITIPTGTKYKALNLSHAVGVILYEFFVSLQNEDSLKGRFPLITRESRNQLLTVMSGSVDLLGFPTPSKITTQKAMWQRVLGKSPVTAQESKVMMGYFRRVAFEITRLHKLLEKKK